MPHKFDKDEQQEVLLDEELDEDIGMNDQAFLVVYNDDVNSFDWVIESFIEVLRHTFEQAEQLSLLIHLKGKATVKTAPMRVLKPQKNALVERGLSAVIETAA
jgi:ATP-dependent Clp protease adaptor protein ClpS